MAVSIKEVSYTYPNNRQGLKGVNLQIEAGYKTAILGLNGSGKSTLLYHLNGTMLPQTGTVQVLGKQVSKKNLRQIRREVGFLFDYPDHQLFSTTVYQDIKFGLDNYQYPEGEKEARILAVAEKLKITDLLDYPPYQLSLGQKKKVAIAGLIVLEPKLIVCDEPFAGLDGPGVADFKKLLEDLVQEGKTIVFSTHDVDLTYEWADQAVILKDGKVLTRGDVGAILAREEVYQKAGLVKPRLYELFAEAKVKPRSIQGAKRYLEKLKYRGEER